MLINNIGCNVLQFKHEIADSVTGPPEYEWTEDQSGTHSLAIISEVAALSDFHSMGSIHSFAWGMASFLVMTASMSPCGSLVAI